MARESAPARHPSREDRKRHVSVRRRQRIVMVLLRQSLARHAAERAARHARLGFGQHQETSSADRALHVRNRFRRKAGLVQSVCSSGIPFDRRRAGSRCAQDGLCRGVGQLAGFPHTGQQRHLPPGHEPRKCLTRGQSRSCRRSRDVRSVKQFPFPTTEGVTPRTSKPVILAQRRIPAMPVAALLTAPFCERSRLAGSRRKSCRRVLPQRLSV